MAALGADFCQQMIEAGINDSSSALYTEINASISESYVVMCNMLLVLVQHLIEDGQGYVYDQDIANALIAKAHPICDAKEGGIYMTTIAAKVIAAVTGLYPTSQQMSSFATTMSLNSIPGSPPSSA